MNNRIRLLSFVLALVLLTGCAAKTAPSSLTDPTTSATSVTTAVTTASTTTITQTTTTESDDTTKTTTTTKTKISVTATYTTRSKPTTHTLPTTSTTYLKPGPTPGPYGPAEGTVPLEQGLDFGGKTYRNAYRGTSLSEKETARIAEFEKTYHAKLDAVLIPGDEYTAALTAARMSGRPYDIVQLSGEDYPTQIMVNVMTPLDNYITTADLYDKKAPEKGGFSVSALTMLQYMGHLYGVSGVFSMDPVVLFYNKALFGENDLLTAACKNGEVSAEWNWERLHSQLFAAQDRDNGVWGLTSRFQFYTASVLNSYGTSAVKTYNYARKPTQNLNDPLVYEAFEMMQKYYCGDSKVADSVITTEGTDVEVFLTSGAAAAVLPLSAYDEIRDLMEQNAYAAFGDKEAQLANVGIAPFPNFATVQVMDDYVGYGAGNGAMEDGILCALAFAKHEAMAAYHASTAGPSWLHKAIASDQLCATPEFASSEGSVSLALLSITQPVAKDQSITVVLKGWEKELQAIVDATAQ